MLILALSQPRPRRIKTRVAMRHECKVPKRAGQLVSLLRGSCQFEPRSPHHTSRKNRCRCPVVSIPVKAPERAAGRREMIGEITAQRRTIPGDCSPGGLVIFQEETRRLQRSRADNYKTSFDHERLA